MNRSRRSSRSGFVAVSELRYGENPHQRGALYADAPSRGGVVAAEQLHGKELSYNNILDADAAWRAANEFPEQAVAVIKHTNPCGLAVHADQAEAYRRAFDGDPVSAYGGILGFNRPVTAEAAEALRRVFFEVIVAPGYEDAALETLMRKRDLRILLGCRRRLREGSRRRRCRCGGCRAGCCCRRGTCWTRTRRRGGW